MTRRDALVALLAGFLTGAAGGFFGVGGGIIMVPLLTWRFRLSQHQAHGTSLAVIGATSLVSIVVYAAHGNVAWLTAIVAGAASIVTARLGARFAARTKPNRLTRAFALFLLVVAIRLLWAPPAAVGHDTLQSEAARVAFDLGLGLGVGLLSGYMGVGGGILIVPALTLFRHWPQQLAQGTSLAVILAVAPSGAIEHARHGNVVRHLIAPLAIGAAIGGPLASLFAQDLDHALLTRAFAVFVLVTATLTWLRAERKGAAREATPVASR